MFRTKARTCLRRYSVRLYTIVLRGFPKVSATRRRAESRWRSIAALSTARGTITITSTSLEGRSSPRATDPKSTTSSTGAPRKERRSTSARALKASASAAKAARRDRSMWWSGCAFQTCAGPTTRHLTMPWSSRFRRTAMVLLGGALARAATSLPVNSLWGNRARTRRTRREVRPVRRPSRPSWKRMFPNGNKCSPLVTLKRVAVSRRPHENSTSLRCRGPASTPSFSMMPRTISR